MHVIHNCLITEEVLTSWETISVPRHNVFFFEKESSAIEWLGDEVFLLSREAWTGNKELNTLDISTALHPWSIKPEGAFVAVVSDSLFQKLDQERRENVFHEQWRLGRGQVVPLSWIMEEVLIHVSPVEREQAIQSLQQNLFNTPDGQMVALQHLLWWELSHEVRVQFLLARAKVSAYSPSVWSDLSPEEQQRIKELNPVVAAYTDTYCGKNGPNCFTTALAGATTDPAQAKWLLTHWMVVEPFMKGLKQRGYTPSAAGTNDLQSGDILIWHNAQNTPVHACFALGNGLVFNTNGQTMFDPWQVLHVETLLEHWDDVVQAGGRVQVYRKEEQRGRQN